MNTLKDIVESIDELCNKTGVSFGNMVALLKSKGIFRV